MVAGAVARVPQTLILDGTTKDYFRKDVVYTIRCKYEIIRLYDFRYPDLFLFAPWRRISSGIEQFSEFASFRALR